MVLNIYHYFNKGVLNMGKKTFIVFFFFLLLATLYSQSFLEYTGCGEVRLVLKKTVEKEFTKIYPDCKFEVMGKGDLYGIREATSGIVDLGGSCRHKLDLPEEKYANALPFAWDALVVEVNKDNPLKSISKEQLKKVLLGEISNWKDLGWEDKKIRLYVRKGKNNGVGRMTRELLFFDPNVEFSSKAIKIEPSEAIENFILNDKYSIGISGIYVARKFNEVKLLALDNIYPTNDNIKRGKYPLFRPLYIIFNPDDASDETRDFVNLLLSPRGSDLLRKNGIIPLKDANNLWKLFEKNIKKAGQNINLIK